MKEIFYCILIGLGLGVFGAGMKNDSIGIIVAGGGVMIAGIDLLIDIKIKNRKN